MGNEASLLHVIKLGIDKLSLEIAKLSGKFDYLDVKVTGINADIGEMKLQMNEMNDKLDTAIGVINDHELRITSLETVAR